MGFKDDTFGSSVHTGDFTVRSNDENESLNTRDQKPYIPSELTSDLETTSGNWTFPVQNDPRYVYVFDEPSMKIRIFTLIKDHEYPAYQCLGCKSSDPQKNLIISCTWASGDLLPSSFIPPPVEDHVCESLTKEEARIKLDNLTKAQPKSGKKSQRVNEAIPIWNEATFTPQPNFVRFPVPNNYDYVFVYDEDLMIRIFRLYRFYNKKCGYRCSLCGSSNKNLVRYCNWPQGSPVPVSFHAPNTTDHICKPLTEEEAGQRLEALMSLNFGNRKGRKRMSETYKKNSENEKKKKFGSQLNLDDTRENNLSISLMETDPEELETDVTFKSVEFSDSINEISFDNSAFNLGNPQLVEQSTLSEESEDTDSAVFPRYQYPIPDDERFVIVRVDNSDKYWMFRLQYKRTRSYYACQKCRKLKKFISFGVVNTVDEVKVFPRTEEHICEPMDKTEAENYCIELANSRANRRKIEDEEEKSQGNRRTSKVSRSLNNSSTDISLNETHLSSVQKVRVVEESDVLPFLIKEPNNSVSVRKFVGSSTGLVCQFCRGHGHQVVGVFSDSGRLTITGDHLPDCKPFNLGGSSKSAECQTAEVEECSKNHENYEITGNVLKVEDREYFDHDGDGKMYYCRICLKTKKMVVEAKVKTVVVEDSHCQECIDSRKSQVEPAADPECPSMSGRAKSVFPNLSPPKDPRCLRAASCAPVPRNSNLSPTVIKEKVAEDLWKIVSNGKKDFLLVKNAGNESEGWEFRCQNQKPNGTNNFMCFDCEKTFFTLDKINNDLYSTNKDHPCRPLPFRVLEQKYEDLRAGIKVNHAWWKEKSKKYGERLINRRRSVGN